MTKKTPAEKFIDKEEAKNNELQEITPAIEKAVIEGKDILSSKQDVLLQIGQIQAFSFISKLVTVTELKVLQNVKESKSYKGLTYKDENNKVVTVTTWEECCTHVLGTEVQNIDNRLRNLSQFGEEFYEASQNMKLGYRDLRALRQLPEGEQALIIDSKVVELGDKEAVKELIEDLTIAHKKAQSKLKGELNESAAQLKANRESSTEIAIKLNDANEELAKRKFSTDKWQDETRDFFNAAAIVHNTMYESLDEMLALNEQLHFTKMDDRAKDAATSAFYADSKLLVERFALTWNEIYQTIGVVEETAKPSGEWLKEMGFEGQEE